MTHARKTPRRVAQLLEANNPPPQADRDADGCTDRTTYTGRGE